MLYPSARRCGESGGRKKVSSAMKIEKKDLPNHVVDEVKAVVSLVARVDAVVPLFALVLF